VLGETRRAEHGDRGRARGAGLGEDLHFADADALAGAPTVGIPERTKELGPRPGRDVNPRESLHATHARDEEH